MRILIINFKLWNSDAWKCVRWFSKLIWKWNCPLPPPLNSYCEICINESWILNDGITASSQMALSGKEPVCQCQRYKRHQVQSVGWEDSLEEENCNTLQYLLPGKSRKSSLAGDSLWGQSVKFWVQTLKQLSTPVGIIITWPRHAGFCSVPSGK